MFREELIAILKQRPTSLHELALLLDVKPRELENEPRHLFRSLRADPMCPVIDPASCRRCGLPFAGYKLHTPGKCPRCKGTWISDPLISLTEKR